MLRTNRCICGGHADQKGRRNVLSSCPNTKVHIIWVISKTETLSHSFCCREGIPSFGPPFPDGSLVKHDEKGRRWFLRKCTWAQLINLINRSLTKSASDQRRTCCIQITDIPEEICKCAKVSDSVHTARYQLRGCYGARTAAASTRHTV